ncbi:MAG: 30S ribosome-binding factor RbfA [Pseudomonadales bacterium]|nr:30S ribosome-binding factor RbfA [Pseudomonadales bacterium]
MKEYGRDLRVADHLRRELATIIRAEMRDPRVGMISVTDVRVSSDLTNAKVYVAGFGIDTQEQRHELLGVLNKASGFLRTSVARDSAMRITPHLRFYYDELIEEGARLESLINKAVKSDLQAGSTKTDQEKNDT